MTRRLHKTTAAWLAFAGGTFGIHRFYLKGWTDVWGWLHILPTALGWYGVERVLDFGQDDRLSWWLLPLLGLSVAASCLAAIVYALSDTARWNARHNPQAPAHDPAGQTSWLTIIALVLSLMLGAVGMMSSLAFSFQRYFEVQVEEGLKLSQ